MNNLNKAIVHIGGEKTGTTTIQAWCAKNRFALSSRGFLYPKSLGGQNHLRLSAYASADDVLDDTRLSLGITTLEALSKFRSQLKAQLTREIEERSEASTLLISNEHLQSRLVSVGEVKRLKSFLKSFVDDIVILVYIRRQDRLATSYYSTRLKADVDDGGAVFPADIRDPQVASYYDYDAMLRRYESVFGPENIRVRIFEPAHFERGDLLADFRANTGIPDSKSLVGVERENESLSELGIEFYRVFNKKVPRFKENKINKMRVGINDAMMKGFAGRGPVVTEEEARAFYERFAASNAAVKKRYFPDMTTPLFEEDFSAYSTPDTEPRPEIDPLDVAIHLWMERTRKIQSLQAENALFRYLASGRDREKKKPPRLPDLGAERALSDFLLMRYVGGLLDAGEYARAIDAAGETATTGTGRPALALAYAIALLRMGDEEAFDRLLAQRGSEATLVSSLESVRNAGIATMEWPKVVQFLKTGDAAQMQVYRKCLHWLQE